MRRSLKASCGDSSATLEILDQTKPVVYHEVICPTCGFFEVLPVDANPLCQNCNWREIMITNGAF